MELMLDTPHLSILFLNLKRRRSIGTYSMNVHVLLHFEHNNDVTIILKPWSGATS